MTVPTPYPTRGLSAAEWRGGVVAVDFALGAAYTWDAGAAIGGYLRGLRSGRILGRRCRACRRVLLPPRMFCEECFRPTDGWVELPPTGRLVSFSVCHVAWDMQPLAEPEIAAVVAVDGAGDGAMLHRLGEVAPAGVSAGMALRAVWRPAAERRGSVTDLAYWAPAGEG
jgi:uncharacterized OB-fold protein